MIKRLRSSIRKPHLLRQLITLIFCAISVFFAVASGAAELRCQELGSNCLCSEPLNTQTYTRQCDLVDNTCWYQLNPADSTTKECTGLGGFAGFPFTEVSNGNPSDVIWEVKTDSAAFAALPAGHVVTAFVGMKSNKLGSYWLTHRGLGVRTKRVAMRFYVYFSPDFQFKGEGSCGNSKLAYMQNAQTVLSDIGAPNMIHMYGRWWNNTSYSSGTATVRDCCLNGPPYADTFADVGVDANFMSSLKGSWLRYEAIITNTSGGPAPDGLRIQVYMQNISTITSERLVIDTGLRDSNLGNWNNITTAGVFPESNDLTPASPLDLLAHVTNRSGSSCTGYYGASHFMVASWDTDSGQRIGPSEEIEGDVVKPRTNTNLN